MCKCEKVLGFSISNISNGKVLNCFYKISTKAKILNGKSILLIYYS